MFSVFNKRFMKLFFRLAFYKKMVCISKNSNKLEKKLLRNWKFVEQKFFRLNLHISIPLNVTTDFYLSSQPFRIYEMLWSLCEIYGSYYGSFYFQNLTYNSSHIIFTWYCFSEHKQFILAVIWYLCMSCWCNNVESVLQNFPWLLTDNWNFQVFAKFWLKISKWVRIYCGICLVKRNLKKDLGDFFILIYSFVRVVGFFECNFKFVSLIFG